MSPEDLGRTIKPFVFLDLFEDSVVPLPKFGSHPHSGIATLTYILEGAWSFRDSNGASGHIVAGGMEWMRAGSGLWHAAEAVPGERTRGFQLWLALPPELELAPPESLYQGPGTIPIAGPTRVLLGNHAGVASVVEPPSPMVYLAISLRDGEHWTYVPPPGHDVLWVAIGKGTVEASDCLQAGDMAVFAPGSGEVCFVAATDCDFVLGSAQRHDHELVLGYYSVHTSDAALKEGEARIAAIGANSKNLSRGDAGVPQITEFEERTP